MKAGFFKITGKEGTYYQKPLFLWIDDPSDDALAIIEFTVGAKFPNGLKSISPANGFDEDYIKYLERDIKIVKDEISKKELLLERLENEYKKYN